MREWYVPNTNAQGMKQGGLNLASSPVQFNNTFLYKSNDKLKDFIQIGPGQDFYIISILWRIIIIKIFFFLGEFQL